MPDDQDAAAPPAPPRPMPTILSTPATPATPGSPAQPATGSWAVDPARMSSFADAIHLVRYRLREVQVKIDEMRSGSYTPKLGSSPVATQLEQKFADRLDAPLDDPRHPTGGGLRPMLAEAMRRMEEFVAGAEAAVRTYQQLDDAAAAHTYRAGANG